MNYTCEFCKTFVTWTAQYDHREHCTALTVEQRREHKDENRARRRLSFKRLNKERREARQADAVIPKGKMFEKPYPLRRGHGKFGSYKIKGIMK